MTPPGAVGKFATAPPGGEDRSTRMGPYETCPSASSTKPSPSVSEAGVAKAVIGAAAPSWPWMCCGCGMFGWRPVACSVTVSILPSTVRLKVANTPELFKGVRFAT